MPVKINGFELNEKKSHFKYQCQRRKEKTIASHFVHKQVDCLLHAKQVFFSCNCTCMLFSRHRQC